MLFLLVISTLTLAFQLQSVKADSGTVNIDADGSASLISGNIVANVTSFEAIRWQQKTFFAAGRYWLFYVDGDYPTETSMPTSTVYYTTSTDGVSWTPPTILASGLSENSGENVEAFLSNNGHLQVFYRSENELLYRMGTPQTDGSITWATLSWQLVFNANAEGETSGTCDFFATVDSNNYPWVSWGYIQEPIQSLNPSDTKMFVWKDAFNNGIWQTASGFPYNVGTGNYTNDFMVPLSNGQIYVMYFLDNPPSTGQIYGELWNGTAWGPQETCTTSQVDEQYAYGCESWDRTAVADSNDNIFLAFLSTDLNLVFVERTMSGGWANETVVQAGCGDYSSPSLNLYNDNLRLFWINSSTSICYKKYVDGAWDTEPTLIVNETNSQIAVGTTLFGTDDGRLNAFTMSLDGSIGLLWVNNQTATNTGQIMFGLQPQTALIFSNIGLSSTAANSTCTFSCLWTDAQGLDTFIFSTNNTGSWQNDSAVSLSGTVAWTNVTKTLNPTVGTVVGYEWFANDTDDNLASTGILTLTTSGPPAYVSTEPIYIMADGSIMPSTAPISSVDNVTYTLTNDIMANFTASFGAIIIQRDNITLDGAGNTVQDINTDDSSGIELNGTSNVTIENMQIAAFFYGIELNSSSNNSVSENNITNNGTGVDLESSSNNNSVSGNSITNDGLGIMLFSFDNGNSVNENNITNDGYGIMLFSFDNDNSVNENNITNNSWAGIDLLSSSNNSVSENNITNTGWAGFDLDYSDNNSVSANNVANNEVGIELDSSSENTFYNNNFIDNTDQVYSSDLTNVWNAAYPTGGNYWSDYKGTDLYHGPYQNQTGSDGIGDTPRIIDVNNTDHYPLMSPFSNSSLSVTISSSSAALVTGQFQLFKSTASGGTLTYTYQWYLNGSAVPGATYGIWTFWPTSAGSYTVYVQVDDSLGTQVTSNIANVTVKNSLVHDVAVTNVTIPVSEAYQGWVVNVNVTVVNFGNATESFSVTLNYNGTSIATLPVNGLAPNSTQTLVFVWNTTNVPCGNYTMEAETLLAPGETNLANSVLVDGTLRIKIMGDINGDGKVDMSDIMTLVNAFGSYPGHPRWNAACDLMQDGRIDLADIVLALINFGETS